MEGLIPHILVAALAAYLLGNLNGAVTVSSLLDGTMSAPTAAEMPA